ncbi:MAG: group I intron-associated PD-(D/E)XK endonuclease [Solirubrobacteraceae bacterium]
MAALPPPAAEPSSHPVEVGQRTEAAILGEFVRRGYRVFVPFGVNHRYDLLLDLGDRFLRVQCKTGRLRNGSVTFRTQSIRSNRRGVFRRGYDGEIDLFAVYCPELDRVYAVPIEVAPGAEGWLRVDPTVNNQSKRIRWAADFELPA